jgi:hypothetical protein
MSNVYGAGAPGAQADPNMIQRLMAYLGLGGAQAAPAPNNLPNTMPDGSPAPWASLTSNGNPLNNPTPVDPRLVGGGPPVPASLTGPSGVNIPLGGGPGMAMDPRGYTGIVPGGGSSGGGGASGSVQMGPEGPAAPPINIPIGGGSGMEMDPKGYTGTPAPVRPRKIAQSGGRSAAGSPSMRRGPASATAQPANSPFTMVDRPNMGPAPMYDQQGNPIAPISGGALARGGPPKMTALDLSKLFSRS